MEIWDAYKEDGTLAGIDLIRGEKIPEGLYHIVSEVLVRHKDGDYLLMQRDMRKATFPGWYEATAVGSAFKGEDGLACAKRELREETGLVAEELELISRYVYGEVIIMDYFCELDCPKDSVKLQDGETMSYKWVSEKEFVDWIESGNMIKEQKWHWTPFFQKMGYVK